MQFPALMQGAITSLMSLSLAEDLSTGYIQQLSKIFGGVLDAQGNSSGIVWLNATNFAPDKLPYIQQDLGIYTFDNLDGLRMTASLATTAASTLKYGDLVYFFTAFAMNGHGPSIQLSSNKM